MLLLLTNLNPFTGDIAIEAFTCLLVFKNLFSFALSWEGIDWLIDIDGGIERLFIYVGSVQVGICLLTVLLCMFLLYFRKWYTMSDWILPLVIHAVLNLDRVAKYSWITRFSVFGQC